MAALEISDPARDNKAFNHTALRKEALEALLTQHGSNPAQHEPHVKRGHPRSGLIWDRLRSGFEFPTSAGHGRVKEVLRWHQSNPRSLNQIMERAEPFMHLIVEEIEQRNMPMEIALLPAIESAFKTNAYSTSHAAGIWQFLPSTGEMFGLKQNWWYDGRQDIYESTRAALDYLQYLNVQFNGDWLLTMAAYNAGPGTIDRAIEKNKRLGKPTDYWSLSLPPQTLTYLPKLLAIREIVEAPDRHGVELWPIKDQPYLSAVEIDSPMDLDLCAELAGLTADAIQELNPGFKRWATGPDGPHRLLLPKDRELKFKTALADTAAEDLLRARHHRVTKGENLGVIAKRYDISVATLQASNELRSNRLAIGDLLLIPKTGRKDLDLNGPESAANEREQIIHVVARGDTFWGIARKHGVTVQLLTQWNKKARNATLSIGEKLVVYRGGNSRKSTS